jgi:hypothetical protein
LGEKLLLRNDRIEAATRAFREAELVTGAGLGVGRAFELQALSSSRANGAPLTAEAAAGKAPRKGGLLAAADSAADADPEAQLPNPLAAAGSMVGTF